MTNHPIQLTRRATLRGLAGAACLAAPARLWAQDAGAPSDFATRAAGLDQLHALVISKGGERVFAEAFRGPALSAPANIKSVSKTLLALLTGRAIAEGALDGTDARVLPLLGRAPAGDARDALTIGHLLSMRTGLDSTSGGDYGAWIASSDWVDYVLTRDLVAEPGGRFIYSTGGWHVLGAVLARATGRDLHDLAQDWIGDPLDLAMPIWVRDPQGRYLGGNEMAVSAAGLARIGEAVLSQDSAIVPQNWIETSWQRRALALLRGRIWLRLVPDGDRRHAGALWSRLWWTDPCRRTGARGGHLDHLGSDAARALRRLFRRFENAHVRHSAASLRRGMGASPTMACNRLNFRATC